LGRPLTTDTKPQTGVKRPFESIRFMTDKYLTKRARTISDYNPNKENTMIFFKIPVKVKESSVMSTGR
jgi:hypothetical protein